MRFYFIIISLILSSLNLYSQSFTYNTDYSIILKTSMDKTSLLNYETLVKSFQENPGALTNQQMLSLLIGYTGRDEYKPYLFLKVERKIYELNDNKDYSKAIALSDSFMTINPLSLMANIEKSYAFHKTEKPDSAQYCIIRIDSKK